MRASNTLYELLENSIKEYKDNIAFSMFGGENVTYAEVGLRVAIVQQMLLDAGLSAGDKVAILSSNMPNWGVCYFAVTTAGMIAVPILPDFTEAELDMLIRHSEAKALFVSDKLFTKLSKETGDARHRHTHEESRYHIAAYEGGREACRAASR